VAEAKRKKPAKAGTHRSRTAETRPDGREPNAVAAELDALAKAAYRKGQFEDAIVAFAEAYEADPLPRFLFNLARSYEKNGDLGPASHYFERYLKVSPEARDRQRVQALARVLRAKLRRDFGLVEVVTEPPGGLVVVMVKDTAVEGVSPYKEWLPFGERELTVSMEGHERFETVIVVRPDVITRVEAKLTPRDGLKPGRQPTTRAASHAAVDASASLPTGEASEDAPEGGSWAAVASFCVAGALLGGAGVFSLLTQSAVEERDQLLQDSLEERVTLAQVREQDDRVGTHALLANVLLGAGAVAATTGAILLLAGGTEEAGGVPRSLGVAPSATGLTLVLRGEL